MPKPPHPLRRARQEYGYSMAQLAQVLELGKNGQNRISEWERGVHLPTLVFANRLASLLNFSSGEQVRSVCRDWRDAHFSQKNYSESPLNLS